jgi:hypothetical protein
MGNLDLKNKKKRWYVEPYPQSFLTITSALEGNQELGTDFCRKQGKYLTYAGQMPQPISCLHNIKCTKQTGYNISPCYHPPFQRLRIIDTGSEY